jgi:iron complex transport system ATP-binding protein
MTSLLDARGLALAGRLQPTDLQSGPGEMVAVIGPNGAGKTSLLRSIAGIEADEGKVRIDGEDVSSASPARRMRLLSFLPATRSLIWPIAARDVVALGLPSPNPVRVEALIALLELEPIAHRPVNHLSTGERSRVLLARALAARPRLLLLDEPLSNLDPYWVIRTLEILRDEIGANESAALVSVHDLNQVASFDRVLLMDSGAIAADGGPTEMLGSAALEQAFRIARAGSGWRINESA